MNAVNERTEFPRGPGRIVWLHAVAHIAFAGVAGFRAAAGDWPLAVGAFALSLLNMAVCFRRGSYCWLMGHRAGIIETLRPMDAADSTLYVAPEARLAREPPVVGPGEHQVAVWCVRCVGLLGFVRARASLPSGVKEFRNFGEGHEFANADS